MHKSPGIITPFGIVKVSRYEITGIVGQKGINAHRMLT